MSRRAMLASALMMALAATSEPRSVPLEDERRRPPAPVGPPIKHGKLRFTRGPGKKKGKGR